jgi:hypothetical protein
MTPASSNAQLHAIDHLYANSLPGFYREIEANAEAIWPRMTLCPVCIYRRDGPAFLYKHLAPPPSFKNLGDGIWQGTQTELQLFGATQVPIQGMLTAIHEYGLRESSEAEFFAKLFHEMHHVYQRNSMPALPQRGDDPSHVTYPEDVEKDALKIYENRLLVQLLYRG